MPGSRRTLMLASASTAMLVAAATPALAPAALFSSEAAASSSASAATTTIIITFVLVTLIALLALAGFLRAIGGKASEDRRTRGTGSVQAKVAGGLGATALGLFIFGIIATESVRSTDADAADALPLTIAATAQQWLWRYEYPIPDEIEIAQKPGVFSFYELVIPVDTPITLEVDSIDVIHNWSVPALSRQIDAVPGEVPAEISFVADEEGVYEGRSNKFSGPSYASMRTVVRVVSQAEYDDWIFQQAEEIKAANEAVQERIDNNNVPGISNEGGGE